VARAGDAPQGVARLILLFNALGSAATVEAEEGARRQESYRVRRFGVRPRRRWRPCVGHGVPSRDRRTRTEVLRFIRHVPSVARRRNPATQTQLAAMCEMRCQCLTHRSAFGNTNPTMCSC
jgi:hypothetical protein